MIWDLPLVVRTARGTFRLVRRSESTAPPEQRYATGEDAERAWAVFAQGIGTAFPPGLDAVFRLYFDLTGDDPSIREGRHDAGVLPRVLAAFEAALRLEWLGFEKVSETEPLGEVDYVAPPPPPLPPVQNPAPPRRPPPPPDPVPVSFELSFADEFGEALSGGGFAVQFRHDEQDHVLPADGSGTARLDLPDGSPFAWAGLRDEAAVTALGNALKPGWDQPRRVQDRRDEILREGDCTTGIAVFRSGTPAAAGSPATPSPLLTNDVRLNTDEPYRICIQPHVELARLRGFYFDTNKCFLLPTAVPDLGTVLELYERNRGSPVLIVGHTDTSGDPVYNDQLSLERAESLAAYLQDRVEAWLAWYGTDKSEPKRWGAREDAAMIESLGARGLSPGSNAVLSYQQWHNALPEDQRAPNWSTLAEDGLIGPMTRAQLVGDYMRHDRTSLPPNVTITTHGCGESFPLDDSLTEIDSAPADDTHDRTDRRVEVFFFDRQLGVQPPPAGTISPPGSPHYPEWRARASLIREHAATPGGPPVAADDFIAIVLLDLDDNPVVGERYTITLADGSERTGQLDDQGSARIEGIPAGDCQISFPDLDGGDWEAA